jgi:hypothetical protein
MKENRADHFPAQPPMQKLNRQSDKQQKEEL